MPNFNNCNIGISLNNNSSAFFTTPVVMKDIKNTAIVLSNNSLLAHAGVSGSTGSSFNIFDSKRGIQIQNNSRVDVENADIRKVQYGLVCLNSSSFDFNKSIIDGGSFYTSFTGQAYGMYVSDNSTGNIFQSSITGYTGGTGSLTSGNIAVVKSSVLFVGTTADSLRVNTVALGSSMIGEVYVDPTFGQKLVGGDSVAYDIPVQGEM